MATDALRKAIDTYDAYIASLGGTAADTATALASRPPTITVPKPAPSKGKTP
jgi:hypothetical protein